MSDSSGCACEVSGEKIGTLRMMQTHAFDETESVRTDLGTPLSQARRLSSLSNHISLKLRKRVEEKQKTTYKRSKSRFGRNSFSRATLSIFLPDKSTEFNDSQCGSNGCISVITCTNRSWATPKEHSVRNVALTRALAL